MIKTISTLFIACILPCVCFSQSKISSSDLKAVSIDSSLSWMRTNAYTGEDLDNFHAIGLQTLKRSLETKNSGTIAEAHKELANWHGYNGIFSPDSVVYHSEKTLEYLIKGTDEKKIADTYRTLSIDYLNGREL